MTPANKVDPRHTDSSPSYKSSEKIKKIIYFSLCSLPIVGIIFGY